MKSLPPPVVRKFKRKCGAHFPIVDKEITSVEDYLNLLSVVSDEVDHWWFRGHSDFKYQLVPSALRYKNKDTRKRALDLTWEFKRRREHEVGPLPPIHWMQQAQHFGLPTRLLDWTESAATALFFACSNSPKIDGVVCVMNPSRLNQQMDSDLDAPLDPDQHERLIEPYIELDGAIDSSGISTIAICPSWKNQRIIAQEGAFTLHGSRKFRLDDRNAPSLFGVPIRWMHKHKLLHFLYQMGKHEMALFPEPASICRHLRKAAKLK